MSNLLESCETFFGTKNLYKVLKTSKSATEKQLRKAYHKLSLQVHPDKAEEDEKEACTEKFQVLGKVYSILTDQEKRAIYDETGCVDEEIDNDDSFDWLAFWRRLFKPITVEDIHGFENKYTGSEEEKVDLKKAYIDGEGDMDYIFEHVPFTSVANEPRIHALLQGMIENDEIPAFKQFTDETPRKRERRKRKYEKEQKEAERELEAQKTSTNDLALAIRKNQEERNGSFLDQLEAKYGGGDKKVGKSTKSKGRKK